MINILNHFFTSIQQRPIELYNEFGLQFEFAIFLRLNYPELNIRLEYPTTRIFNTLPGFVKKEIDIYVTAQDGQCYVIELKLPKADCGTPDAMYGAVKDVKFLEQLRENGIDGCSAILFKERPVFWQAPQVNEFNESDKLPVNIE
jgi:hypothetical protein